MKVKTLPTLALTVGAAILENLAGAAVAVTIVAALVMGLAIFIIWGRLNELEIKSKTLSDRTDTLKSTVDELTRKDSNV